MDPMRYGAHLQAAFVQYDQSRAAAFRRDWLLRGDFAADSGVWNSDPIVRRRAGDGTRTHIDRRGTRKRDIRTVNRHNLAQKRNYMS